MFKIILHRIEEIKVTNFLEIILTAVYSNFRCNTIALTQIIGQNVIKNLFRYEFGNIYFNFVYLVLG